MSKKLLTLFSAILLVSGENVEAEPNQSRQSFPIPRAEFEFSSLIAFPTGVGFHGPVELPMYLALASPFGTLDLQVTRAADGDEASLLKNFYLGVSGRILKIDTAKLANSFQCGPECTGRRKELAVKNLKQVRELVDAFLQAKNIAIAAQGYNDNRFPINNVFVLGDWAREAIPSPNMGFIPSGQWNEFRNLDEYFEKSQIDRADAMRLIDGLKNISFTAIERSGANSVRVFLAGIGDNVAGLLFQNGDSPPPVLRAMSADGLEYVILEEIESGLWYFETT